MQTPLGGLAEFTGEGLHLMGGILQPRRQRSARRRAPRPVAGAARMGADLAAELRGRAGPDFSGCGRIGRALRAMKLLRQGHRPCFARKAPAAATNGAWSNRDALARRVPMGAGAMVADSAFGERRGLAPRLSTTVAEVRRELSDRGPVGATEVIEAILRRHSEYAPGADFAAVKASVETERLPVDVWLERVRNLYEGKLQKLHGRLVIIGLGLLNADLRLRLTEHGFWDALLGKLRDPFDSLLSQEGRQAEAFGRSATVAASDHVPTLPDNPLDRLDQDRLGRAAFARFLARRMAALSEENASYAIHLSGPWGAGKSTLLNFLKEVLESGAFPPAGAERRQWLVVSFNAWRNQHVRPPWWILLDTVFQQTRRKMSLAGRVREHSWRLWAERGPNLASLLVLIVVAWGLWFLMAWLTAPTEASGDGMPLKDVVQVVSTLLVMGVTLWGIAAALPGMLSMGSARAARSYVEVSRDPMNAIKRRFEGLIGRLHGHRVVILIDDLDRCRSEYATELLEGVQTLFRDAPVFYVVAADRRWLNACYEEAYHALKARMHDTPGKSLGTLFLEKTFQLSVPVPAVPVPVKETYWDSLLHRRRHEPLPNADDAKARQVEDLDDDAAMIDRLGRSIDPVEQQRIRERIVDRLAAPEVVARTEHALTKFAPLLDANPRAMKRLVNAYSTYRALATLSHIDVERDQLALWTILSLRWPELVDTLSDRMLEGHERPDAASLADGPGRLLADGEVQRVVSGGGGVAQPLEIKTVREFARLRA